MVRQDGLQRLVDQCRFARARYTRHHNKFAQWERCVDVLQVIAAGPMDTKTLPRTLSAREGSI